MLRSKMLITAPNKVDLGLRELKKATSVESLKNDWLRLGLKLTKKFSMPWLMNFLADLKQL